MSRESLRNGWTCRRKVSDSLPLHSDPFPQIDYGLPAYPDHNDSSVCRKPVMFAMRTTYENIWTILTRERTASQGQNRRRRQHVSGLSFKSTIAVIAILLMTRGPAVGQTDNSNLPFVMVLGTAQDAGFPQAGCNKECCQSAWETPSKQRFATSLAIVDPTSNQRWLLDCTPDFREQLRLLQTQTPAAGGPVLDGIFLTHAHVGHYAGLIHLGREVIGADSVKVYAMPRMSHFLATNGPWEQLVTLKNITLCPLAADTAVQLNARISVTPILVPHRDEYSETVGFEVRGPNRKILFIPDIDKWDKWDQRVEEKVTDVDVAYLDGTFFGNGEIPGRDMSLIPHPSITESMERFSGLTSSVRSRVRFIHLNHTNPVLDTNSAGYRILQESGCRAAQQGEQQKL